MNTPLTAIGLVILGCFIGAFGAVYLKKGAADFSFNPLKLIKNYQLIAGGMLYGIATVLYMMALRKGNLSVLYPIVSTTYIFVSILSVKMLGEKMNRWRVMGIAAIILGVSLIGLNS